ncbi:MAG TPA: hypothetical protein VMV79_01850 [Alphaproteobacteria bacterium]|nr:hypothetical protein [Alphaproteobacteria bacterium]
MVVSMRPFFHSKKLPLALAAFALAAPVATQPVRADAQPTPRDYVKTCIRHAMTEFLADQRKAGLRTLDKTVGLNRKSLRALDEYLGSGLPINGDTLGVLEERTRFAKSGQMLHILQHQWRQKLSEKPDMQITYGPLDGNGSFYATIRFAEPVRIALPIEDSSPNILFFATDILSIRITPGWQNMQHMKVGMLTASTAVTIEGNIGLVEFPDADAAREVGIVEVKSSFIGASPYSSGPVENSAAERPARYARSLENVSACAFKGG